MPEVPAVGWSTLIFHWIESNLSASRAQTFIRQWIVEAQMERRLAQKWAMDGSIPHPHSQSRVSPESVAAGASAALQRYLHRRLTDAHARSICSLSPVS